MPTIVPTSIPLRNMKFSVSVPTLGLINIGFSSVSGLQTESELIEYREGNQSMTPRKQPGIINYPEVTLSRGVTSDTYMIGLLTWREMASSSMSDVIGSIPGQESVTGMRADGLPLYKHDVYIYVGGRDGAASFGYRLSNAWPLRIEYEDLDANANDVWIGSTVLVHEGLDSLSAIVMAELLGEFI